MAIDPVVNFVMGGVIDQLRQQSRKALYYDNPVLWAKDVLGIEPWSKQRDILNSVQNNIRTCVRSCHGSGKSFIASIIAAWWVSTRPLGEAIVVTTAPTYHQVHSILWEDIRKHHINARERYKEGLSPMELPGYITQSDQWKTDDGMLIGFGRKPADNNDHGFQGIHRRYVLVIIDESCGIKQNLFTAVEAITTTENSRILAIGNPDDPSAHFYEFFKGRLGPDGNPIWNAIDVSSFDSPNFTRMHEGHYEGCDDPLCLQREYAGRWDRDKDINPETLPLLPNKTWVDDRRVEWGEDSALWASKVLGAFPDVTTNTLFSVSTIYTGHSTEVKPLQASRRILGVDVARFGADYSTVYMAEQGVIKTVVEQFDEETGENLKPVETITDLPGVKVRMLDFWGKTDAVETVNRIHQLALKHAVHEVRIDGEGMGGPMIDSLTRLADTTYRVVAMRSSASSPDRFRWLNARAWWYAEAERRMRVGEIDTDPRDEKLQSELLAHQYHFKNQFTSLQIESKDEMERRGIKSPDFSDAFCYAVADMDSYTANPLSGYRVGDQFSYSPEQILGYQEMNFGILGPY